MDAFTEALSRTGGSLNKGQMLQLFPLAWLGWGWMDMSGKRTVLAPLNKTLLTVRAAQILRRYLGALVQLFDV